MVDPILAGLVGGFLATLVMGVIARSMLTATQPLPSQLFASRFINDKPPEDNRTLGWVIHLVYGTLMGVLWIVMIVALVPTVFDRPLLWLTGYGLAWGILLWLLSFFWLAVVGTLDQLEDVPGDTKMTEIGVILLMHVVYGTVLGLVAGVLL